MSPEQKAKIDSMSQGDPLLQGDIGDYFSKISQIHPRKVERKYMIRTYTIVCPSCKSAGWIDNWAKTSSSSTIVCPACKGSGLILVTESDDEGGNYAERCED